MFTFLFSVRRWWFKAFFFFFQANFYNHKLSGNFTNRSFWKHVKSRRQDSGFLCQVCQTNWIFLCQNDRPDTSLKVAAVIYLDFKWVLASPCLAYKLQTLYNLSGLEFYSSPSEIFSKLRFVSLCTKEF